MKLGKENLRKKTVKSETANGTIERIQSKLESRGVGVLIRRARRTLGVERRSTPKRPPSLGSKRRRYPFFGNSFPSLYDHFRIIFICKKSGLIGFSSPLAACYLLKQSNSVFFFWCPQILRNPSVKFANEIRIRFGVYGS